MTISRLINAFFRWEFNSCETLVRGTEAHPIDYANASPGRRRDVAALLLPVGDHARCCAGARSAPSPAARRGWTSTRARYFEIGDREDLTYEDKLAEYRRLADEYFETERYTEFCATAIAARSTSSCSTGSPRRTSTGCSSRPSQATYPPHEHERFLAHFRGLVGLWVADSASTPPAPRLVGHGRAGHPRADEIGDYPWVAC